MSAFISLEQAIAMTTLYRNQKETVLAVKYQHQNILANCETFERDNLETLLAKPGCEKIRVYYGMSEDLKVHAILVPVNVKDEDILPDTSTALGGPGDGILDEAVRCPVDCPPPSPLNP